ncbi:hypothetical protein B0H15DRAFT_736723, partial [Mycena belliarum]
PEAFDPERFLRDGKDIDPAFGFGRRSCPGKIMALDTLWIMIASLLAVFDIAKPIGPDGEPIEPPAGFVADLGLSPLPFECAMKPRSEAAAKLIR